ncbi:hypothetical protein [Absidia glauca]|uniref:SPX domain-containing protein n=1 Tax=Absidia glauca TaxID=4829 RepID=A0A168L3K7_ABSGL|nr:hypothetical protein [Absidia glauca]
MKFAKCLETDSIPEWRRAYINYKGLKKRLRWVDKFRKSNEHKAALELAQMFQDASVAEEDDTDHRAWWNPWPLHRPSSLSLLRQWTSKKNVMDTTLSPRPGTFKPRQTIQLIRFSSTQCLSIVP